MYPANIPVNPYKLNLNKKGDKYTTCTVLRKICLPIAKAPTPLTRVKPICSIQWFFFDASSLRTRLSPILFHRYYFPSSRLLCKLVKLSRSRSNLILLITRFLSALFFLVASFLLFTSFVWSFNPGIYNTATFLFRLIGASFFHRSRRIFPDRFLSK